jgi:hypothetical protein
MAVILSLAMAETGCGGDPCEKDETLCRGSCVDTDTHPQHCGGCGISCSNDEVCIEGSCQPQCSAGETQCGNSCVDTDTNPQHCGACGTACAGGKVCVAGSCVLQCSAGQQQCGGTCVDTNSNSQHCGACGVVCDGGKVCTAGSCVLQCPAGQSECGGACIDTQTSPQHCGGCGNVCEAGESCQAGTCTAPCPGGQTWCDGACVDTKTNTNHCGSCGNACASGKTCSAGTCGGCLPGLSLCGTACVDFNTDPANCGACGNTCQQGEACLQGSCKPPTTCAASLQQPKTDAWGTQWDGFERVAATYAAAKQQCEAIKGRLPTSSELFRVNATQADGLGLTSTNYLWALTPNTPTEQFTVRLSDGATDPEPNNTTLKHTYRCVCAPTPPAFTGNACFGPAGSACFALPGSGRRYNIDKKDRPKLSRSGAHWECAFQRAHLADYAVYVEGILTGLPNGSSNWLHVSNDSRGGSGTILRWTAVTPSWVADGNTSSSTLTTLRPFRCAGPNFATGTHPNTVADEYVGPLGGYKGEKTEPIQATWELAHDGCWNRGGHLPRSAELAELIQQGLPNGSGLWLWSSDQLGAYSGSDFRGLIMSWTGTMPGFGYLNPTFVGSGSKAGAQRPFRCIYYPLDSQYAGPTAAACQGGCTRLALPGTTPAVMWMDTQDRSTAKLESAMSSCAALGGQLASARDYTEAIRHGLPNGSGVHLLTSDMAYDHEATTPISRVIVLRWSGTNRDFNDQYPAYTTWSDLKTARPYRCMWTNELR